MALSARPASFSTAPSATNGRVPSGSRGVAAMSDAPIEEIGTKTDVQANANFNFQGFADWTKDRQHTPANPLTNTSAQFDTFSSTFLNLLDNAQFGRNGGSKDASPKPTHPNFVAKAINAYEDTAIVINRKATPLGSSLSLSL